MKHFLPGLAKKLYIHTVSRCLRLRKPCTDTRRLHRRSVPMARPAPRPPAPRTAANEPALARLRVAKRYAPHQDGAKRFHLRYGEQLVCVRHRLSDDGRIRHTTVELLIESTPIVSRQRSEVAVRLASSDRSTRQLLMACGAHWRPKERVWLLPYLVAKNLRLLKFRVPLPA